MNSRPYTAEEIRDKILRHMKAVSTYWATVPQGKTTEERISGAMFSVLAMLDGSTMDLPAFNLVACPHEDDKDFHIRRGENWIEQNTIISFNLHEHWHRIEREFDMPEADVDR